jgi:type 1 glutamine amidotransferase
MHVLRWLFVVLVILGTSTGPKAAAQTSRPSFAALVFSKTTGFRHDSIPNGIAAIRALGTEHGFTVDDTEDAGRFTDTTLARYRAVVFLSTTGDILDQDQKAAFERYIRSGGGFVGVHSASDTEYQWPWYGRLVGTWFASHPQIQRATIRIEDLGHASTEGLPATWERTDEWYNFRSNPRGTVHVLGTLDEATYSGGKMGADHPIAWCQEIDGGRSWYTAMGHTSESYAEPLFRLHLLGGIESAAGVAGGCPSAGEKSR